MRAGILILPAVSLLAACAVGPAYHRPEIAAPDSFRGAEEKPETKSLADLPWWQIYQDKTLQELLKTALEHNRDVQIAAARVAESRALVGVTRYAQFPPISVGAGASRSRVSEVSAVPIPAGVGTDRRSVQASVDTSFEIDLWRRLSSLTQAAKADLLASEFARETVRIGLIADVATAYFDLLALDQQLAITERTVATREKFLELTQARFQRGAASGLDVNRAESVVALARANIPDLQRQIAQTENALRILLGENPGPVVRERLELQTMPVPPDVPAGLPATLLERRPDLRQAEYNLIGTNARLRSIKAALFPTISLTGSLGSESAAMHNLFTGPARTWSYGLNVLQPLLDPARNRYQVDAAAAREQQAALQYQKAVQQAFREVADALAAHDGFARFRREQETQVKALRNVSQQALLRYEVGYSSYFEVVDAERDLFTAELQLVQADRNTLVSLVQLYKALGGGWETASVSQDAAASPEGRAAGMGGRQ